MRREIILLLRRLERGLLRLVSSRFLRHNCRLRMHVLVAVPPDGIARHFKHLLRVHTLQLAIEHVLRRRYPHLRRSCHSRALEQGFCVPHDSFDDFLDWLNI